MKSYQTVLGHRIVKMPRPLAKSEALLFLAKAIEAELNFFIRSISRPKRVNVIKICNSCLVEKK